MILKQYILKYRNSLVSTLIKFPSVTTYGLIYFCRAYSKKNIELSGRVITPDLALIICKKETFDIHNRSLGHEVCIEKTGDYFGHLPLRIISNFFNTEDYFSWN